MKPVADFVGSIVLRALSISKHASRVLRWLRHAVSIVQSFYLKLSRQMLPYSTYTTVSDKCRGVTGGVAGC
jgi:hypothetical protein